MNELIKQLKILERGMKMNKIINLTPHEVTLITKTKNVIFPRLEEAIPRLTEDVISESSIEIEEGHIPTVVIQTGQVRNLPPKVQGTYYIVSRVVLQNSFRHDFLVPDTLVVVDGEILGCSRFVKN